MALLHNCLKPTAFSIGHLNPFTFAQAQYFGGMEGFIVGQSSGFRKIGLVKEVH
jgi:hypothetical protein